MNKRQPPTELQLHLWSVMDRMTAENKRPPSIRELMVEAGASSTSSTIYRLDRGVREGRVIRTSCSIGHVYVPAWWQKMINENLEKYYGNTNSN